MREILKGLFLAMLIAAIYTFAAVGLCLACGFFGHIVWELVKVGWNWFPAIICVICAICGHLS